MSILSYAQDVSLGRALAYGIVIYTLYSVATIIHYLFFHPLARYPGPLLAKISLWPSFYHTLRGNRHIWLWQLQEVYGPVIRYRPDCVLFQTPEAFPAIYGSNANVKKAKQYKAWARHVTAQTTFTTTDKSVHARKRRVLNAAFSDKAMRSAEKISLGHINRWCDLLGECSDESQWSEPKNMTTWSDYLLLDILSELSFGRSFDTKEPGDNPKKTVPHSVVQYLKLMYPITWSPFLDLWIWLKPRGLDWLIESNLPEGNKQMMAIVDSCIAQRVQEEHIRRNDPGHNSKDGSKDLLHYLLKAEDPEGGPGFTPLELRAETELLLSAGFDTTATVMAAMFFYLSRNPKAYSKLAEEIRQTFNKLEDIFTGPTLSSCVYLRAVIDETMRMSPPGSSEGVREVLPGGIVVQDQSIPKGLIIGTALYALHHNQDIFHDPFNFRPERWIRSEDVSAENVALAESAFFPFSLGSRSCPGKRLAYQEMSTAIARMIFRFEFQAVERDTRGLGGPGLMWGRRNKTQWQHIDALVAARDGPLIQFKRRSP